MKLRRTIAILLAVGVSSQSLSACLLESYSIEDEYERSEIVATGTVVSSESIPESLPHYDGINYKVQLASIYKGPAETSVTIFSENSTGRFPMEVGREYMLFIYESTGRYFADNCGNSGPSTDRELVIETIRNLAQ